MNKHILCSWSGGKDSCYALMKAKEDGFIPRVLLNVLNEEGKISRSHGIPSAILRQQASQAGIPMTLISSSWAAYESNFKTALLDAKHKYNVSHAVFGDIDLQAHRDWEEMVCEHAGLVAHLPLWSRSRKQLVLEMLESGIETMIVSCNPQMGKSYIGEYLSLELINRLEESGIDACGENGEYHTLVVNCPLFSQAINVKITDVRMHNDYWFAQIS